MNERTALEMAGDLETFGQGWLDAVDMLRQQHAEIGRLRDGLSVIANGRCADVYADRVLMGIENETD